MAKCNASFPSEFPLDCIQATLAAFKAKDVKTALASAAFSVGCLSTLLPTTTPKPGPDDPWAPKTATADVTQMTDDQLVSEVEGALAGLPPAGTKGAISASLILWIIQLILQVLARTNTPPAA